MDGTAPLLNDTALDALNRTRPWMYLLGVFSVILTCFGLLAVTGGLIGLGINPARAHQILGGGIALVVVCGPSAVVQLGYALALSRLGEASGPDQGTAVELACVRQRNLWIVNGLIAGLASVLLVIETLRAAFG